MRTDEDDAEWIQTSETDSGDRQGVALTGRNRTGPPCSVGRLILTRPADDAPTFHAPGGRPARTPAALQTTNDRQRRQTPASKTTLAH